MTDEKLVTIEVDGRKLEVSPGAMLIEVTDAAGISIPRFCYHKKLSVAANCRMCLVDVENIPKPLPACATPVMDGMKVHTRSPKALAAQHGTMEFLLINHPLDCPICDQGGECELQDVAIGYGRDLSRFTERKRVVKDEDLGPLIATEMTRCIHCSRCIRFGAEIAGVRELGATGRGEHMRIGTYVAKTVDHELAGNIIDLCPVGALTAKPSRFQARAWELAQSDGIASHDSVGSNLYLHVRRGRLLRVHPRDNEAVNETWLSDRDRFSYQGLYADDRLQTPMIRENGLWREADWDEALQLVAGRLKEVAAQDADQFATLLSPRATLEEMYLAQKLTRGLGSPHVDCRLRQGAFNDAVEPLFPWLGMSIAELEQVDAALVIGSHLRKDQPLLAHRLRKAALDGAHITFVNPFQLELSHPARQLVGAPAAMRRTLASIAQALEVGGMDEGGAEEDHAAVAQQIKEAGNAVVLLGNLAASSPDFVLLKGLAQEIAQASGARLGYLSAGPNSTGAALAGALPHVMPGAQAAEQPGANAARLFGESRRAYLMIGFEPDADTWDPMQAQASLKQSEFVVALTAWRSPALDAAAQVLLPVADFAETAGTYVNAEGLWQDFQGAVMPPGSARPAWKVLRVLGNLVGLDGFSLVNVRQVRDELEVQCKGARPDNRLRDRVPRQEDTSAAQSGLQRLGDVPIYAVDGLVRRAGALQQTTAAMGFGVWLHPAEAARLGLEDGARVRVVQGNNRVETEVHCDRYIAEGCARIPAAIPGSGGLGAAFGTVTLEKV
jgi:NADH-quinone oxidoreductase subunit G